MTPEQISASKLAVSHPEPLPGIRKREIVWMFLTAVLLLGHLTRHDWRDDAAIEEAKERIELSLKTCQRAIDSAEKHANVLATLLNEGHHVLTAPGAKAYCKTYKVKS